MLVTVTEDDSSGTTSVDERRWLAPLNAPHGRSDRTLLGSLL